MYYNKVNNAQTIMTSLSQKKNNHKGEIKIAPIICYTGYVWLSKLANTFIITIIIITVKK